MPNLSILKSIKLSKETKVILFLILASTVFLWSVAAAKGLWPFIFYYLKYNGIQLAIILLFAIVIFYNSYIRLLRIKPSKSILFIFIVMISLFSINFIAFVSATEQVLQKAMFSMAEYLFINLALILSVLFLSWYDMTRITDWRKTYFTGRDNGYKNLGLILSIVFITSLAGMVNGTFVYAVIAAALIIHMYLFKGLFANLRK